MIVCISEDRKGFQPSIELLVLSLAEHCPKLAIYLIFPNADQKFVSWLSGFPQVTLRRTPLPTAYGVNVKPQAILHLFDEGHDDVLWIDSDIIVTDDLSKALAAVDTQTLVLTEEALWTPYGDPDGMRARMWGFKVGRVLPFALNTGVIRVTRQLQGLMVRWRALLESEEYRAAQNRDWRSRPLHMISDQDVLTALLASEEFAWVPLRFLLRGKDIVQYFGPYGYTLRERLIHLSGHRPAFIHSQGPKPWLWKKGRAKRRSARSYLYDLYLELSPYTLAARKYRGALSEPAPWMASHSLAGSALRALGFWYSPLVGLPIAMLADLVRVTKPLFRTRNQ